MVTRIKQTDKDREGLLSRAGQPATQLDTNDFSGVVVNKPWGYEYLMYEDKEVAIWMLYIKKGHSTSMHCHPKKKSSLLMISGEAITSTLNESFNLKEKEGVIIEKGVFHKTEAISEGGIFLIELETPPDKMDLFRLKDLYKRETQGYTLKKNVTNKTYNYHYFFLENMPLSNNSLGKYKFSLRDFKNNEELSKMLPELNADLAIILSGKIEVKGEYFDTGDLIEIDKLSKSKFNANLKVLLIQERKNLVRVSDYAISLLEKHGIKDAFFVSGGRTLYLLESLRKSKMNRISNHHEQASSIAADSYAKITGNVGFVIINGGSGASNAITGVANAWTDSTPMLVISGQSYANQTIGDSGLRQMGVHELNIIDIVRPITKYAIMVRNPKKIKYHLEKALYLAKSGRPGPVWIDIPIDIQMAMIDEKDLDGFKVPEQKEENFLELKSNVKNTLELLKIAKRPIILLGNGVRISDCKDEFLELASKLSIPLVTSRSAADLVSDDNQLYAGRPGMFGQRAANFAVQNSDFLLSIGSGIGLSMTGWAYKDFARDAKKVIVDIDFAELKKPFIKADIAINASADKFIFCMSQMLQDYKTNEAMSLWKEQIANWKKKYPMQLQNNPAQGDYVNPYSFVDKLSKMLTSNDFVVTDTSLSLQCAMQCLKLKPEQRLIMPSGLGLTGYGLPGAIGACVGKDRKRTICLTGDGGLQFNVQELQTISHNNLPVKIFVLSNNNYSLMRELQKRYFGKTMGSDSSSGISMPDVEKMAFAYGIKSNKIEKNEFIEQKIKEALDYDGPFICNINISEDQHVIPRQGSFNRPDGKTVPRPIEDMYPYLDREELESEMIIDPIYFDPYLE